MKKELEKYIDKKITIWLKNGVQFSGIVFAVTDETIHLAVSSYIKIALVQDISLVSYDTEDQTKG